tara:strand:- start:20422 stop:20829 length:408 start_codon:yes stop_codon:yes gene_type:complete
MWANCSLACFDDGAQKIPNPSVIFTIRGGVAVGPNRNPLKTPKDGKLARILLLEVFPDPTGSAWNSRVFWNVDQPNSLEAQMRYVPGKILGLTMVFTAIATPVWASVEIPEPASIGGYVLGIGAAWLIIRARRKK